MSEVLRTHDRAQYVDNLAVVVMRGVLQEQEDPMKIKDLMAVVKDRSGLSSSAVTSAVNTLYASGELVTQPDFSLQYPLPGHT